MLKTVYWTETFANSYLKVSGKVLIAMELKYKVQKCINYINESKLKVKIEELVQ